MAQLANSSEAGTVQLNEIDEGPSAEDLDRFGGETGYCPHCGEEIWDAAPACPACGEWVSVQRRPPRTAARKRILTTVIALVTLIAFSGLLVFLSVLF